MGNIVYTERANKPRIPEADIQSPITLDEKFTIFQSADKVSAVRSVLRAGRFHNTKRVWFRWGTVQAFGFRRNKAGYIQPYHAGRSESLRVTDLWKPRNGAWAFAHLGPSILSDGFCEAYRRACESSFNIKSMTDVYPLADHYGIYKYSGLPANVRTGLREKNISDMVAKTFGKQRAGIDWYTAAKNTDLFLVSVAHEARGLVEDKTLLTFLNQNKFDEDMEGTFEAHTPVLRPVLRKVEPKSREVIIGKHVDNMDLLRFKTLSEYASRKSHDGKNYWLQHMPVDTEAGTWAELNKKVTGRDF